MPRSALGLRITTTCICSPPFRFLAHPMQAGTGTFRQGQQCSVCDGLHHHQRTAAGGDGDAVRPGSVLVADAQRVAGGQLRIVQLIVGAALVHALRPALHREDREVENLRLPYKGCQWRYNHQHILADDR